MPAQKLPKDYHKLAESKGIKWLGLEVPNVMTKTWWECDEGHEWEAVYSSVRRGTGCPYCYGNAPKGLDDYYGLAKERNLKWLGQEIPQGVNTKSPWRCSRGHEWGASYSSLQQGSGCPYCAGTRRKTPKDYYKLAEKRGFKWLGPEVPTARDKTWWECSKNHRWETTHDNIQRRGNCPQCTLEKLSQKYRLKPSDYYKLAESKGFEWLGPEVPNIFTKTYWHCSKGHEWETTYGSLYRSGCPHCSGKAPKTIDDYHELAKINGFKWTEKELPKNVVTKSWWHCINGHKWETCYDYVQSGYGCPICDDRVNGIKVSKLQRRVCAMVDGKLNYPIGSYYVDVTLLDEKIAIEYDCWYWHGNREKYDARRDRELIDAGWKMLHIKSNNELPTQHQLGPAFDLLRNGEVLTEIVLGDWGKGPVFARART